jgi:hypothetical protein|tara:strand:+ start:367 stop:747 length:381 start_codon:yes stop_codon:yes gene_type:complete
MGIINKTLMEVTTEQYNRIYKKSFPVKELVYDEDQQVIIDLESVYTTISEWGEFLDKMGEKSWDTEDIVEHFGVGIADTMWEKETVDGGSDYGHIDDIVNIKKADYHDARAMYERVKQQDEKVNNE